MVSIKPGDILKDNDPRVQGRTVKVITIGDTKVVCEPHTLHPHGKNAHRVLVSLTRIYDDGKERKSGFSVVRSSPSEPAE